MEDSVSPLPLQIFDLQLRSCKAVGNGALHGKDNAQVGVKALYPSARISEGKWRALTSSTLEALPLGGKKLAKEERCNPLQGFAKLRFAPASFLLT